MLLPILTLGAALLVTVADNVPNFDARPGCQAGAESGIDTQPNVEACVQSELQARKALATQWKDFFRDDKARCVAETQEGGPPSYIEVLTCLEIARDTHGMKVE